MSKGTLRLDDAVAEKSGVTQAQARSLIMEGRVRVDGEVASKAGLTVRAEAAIDIEPPRRFVSRGGEKLEHALDCFGIDPTGLLALDVGASTGGFTDCLLQQGAAHVTGPSTSATASSIGDCAAIREWTCASEPISAACPAMRFPRGSI